MDIPTAVEDIAERALVHLSGMRRRVPRSRTGVGGLARCREAGAVYLRERNLLAGKAREATKTKDGWKVGRKVREFDRASMDAWAQTEGTRSTGRAGEFGKPGTIAV